MTAWVCTVLTVFSKRGDTISGEGTNRRTHLSFAAHTHLLMIWQEEFNQKAFFFLLCKIISNQINASFQTTPALYSDFLENRRQFFEFLPDIFFSFHLSESENSVDVLFVCWSSESVLDPCRLSVISSSAGFHLTLQTSQKQYEDVNNWWEAKGETVWITKMILCKFNYCNNS